ncbi:MAG: BON domain-containing protein [Mycobacteriaceae bacterium]
MTQTLLRTDHQLKSAILEGLSQAPNLHSGRIGVSLTDGAVTLSGRVPTHPEKEAAVRATMRVLGVTAIADEIIAQHGPGSAKNAAPT